MESYLDEFPALREYAYLNTASEGLLPSRSAKALSEYARRRQLGSLSFDEYREKVEETRKLIGKLIGAREDEIALMQNTSEGLNVVINSLEWERGDSVVTCDLEFPTVVFPLQKLRKELGVELRVMRSINGVVPDSEVERCIDETTKLVCVSHVEFATGYKFDLRKISKLCREYQAFLLVDGGQSVGATGIRVREAGVDFLASSGSKWMLGPEGTGFLYVRKDLADELEPPRIGWLSDKRPGDFSFREYELADGARRFECGTVNMGGFAALGESVRLLLEVGVEKIKQRVENLSSYLRRELAEIVEVVGPRDEEHSSGIVSFRHPRADGLFRELMKRKVVVSLRLGMVRASTHFYNSEEDISKLLEIVRKSSTR